MEIFTDHPTDLQFGRADGVGGRRSVVDEATAQTLTNKTLTAPTVTAPVMTGGTLTPAVLILPTEDPLVEGALWNDSGTVTVSAGPE